MTTAFFFWLALFFIFVAASAFFAASETALVALGRVEIERLRHHAPSAAARIESAKKRPTEFLSAALMGQNLCNSAASAVATVALGIWIGQREGTVAAVILSALFLFTLGEILPKSLAAAAPAWTARIIAAPFRAYSTLIRPLTTLATAVITRTLALAGIAAVAPPMSEEEMKAVINLGHAEGAIGGQERELMVRILEFGDRHVSEVMVPRPAIAALPDTASFEEVRRAVVTRKFSRFPVYRGSLDNVIGIFHARDIFDVPAGEVAGFALSGHVGVPFFVPESKRLEELLREMRRRKQPMAVALDEYGGTAGLATITDLIEEVFGAIPDEYGEESPGYEKITDRTFLLDGTLKLDELARRFGISYPQAQAETVAGLLLLRFGRIPRKGERLRGRQAEFIVVDATATAIKKIKMILPRPSRPGEANRLPGNA